VLELLVPASPLGGCKRLTIYGILLAEVFHISTELIELSDALAQSTDRAAASVLVVHTESGGTSSGVV